MTSAVETMAWKGEVPWHGLGFEVKHDASPQQMLKAAKIDWSVSKQPLFVKRGDKYVEYPGKMELKRDSDDKTLTMVGKNWKPVQNDAMMEFFAKFVKAGKMKMETAGSLWGGRYIWALARMQADFAIDPKKKDVVQNYLLLMSPHVHGKAMIAQWTGIRVVCWNTLSMALGNNLKGGKNAFRMPHTVEFDDDVKEKAAVALNLAKTQAEQFKDAAQLLAKKKAKDEQVLEYFCEVMKFDPKAKDAPKLKKTGEVRLPNMVQKFESALLTAPGQQLSTAKGTWWGALNAVTAVIDHQNGRGADTALKNAWVGHTAGLKRRALDLAIKAAS